MSNASIKNLSSRPTAKRAAKPYKVVGTTHDGVKILAPKSKPTHFTSSQIKATIRKIREESRTRG